MTTPIQDGILTGLSSELAGVVEQAAPSVVRVDDGTRLTATGLIWSSDGLIMTSSHGVERDDNLAVEMADGARYAAALVGRDPDTDIAALRIKANDLPAIERSAPEDVKVGSLVLALGRPGTSGLQATIGIVSARMESQTNGQPGYILYTDAVLYPGFSGGALVDMRGKLVGMTNLLYGRGRGVAIGSSIVEQTAEGLQAYGRIQRGYLGVRTQPVALPASLRQSLGLKQESGVLIVQIEGGSAAELGGLLLGDVILRLNDLTVEDVESLRRYLRSLRAGQTIALTAVRAGALHTMNITLGSEA